MKMNTSTEEDINIKANLDTSWLEQFQKAFSELGGTKIVSGGLASLYTQLKKIPEEVYKVDTAMTELSKVTNETNTTYSQYLNQTNLKAQELGRSVTNLIEQTTTLAKQGFSLDDSAKLTEAASIYANISGIDDTTALSELLSVMQTFNIEAENSIQIVDSLCKLSEDFDITTGNLGNTLSNSASSLALSGTSLEKTLALLAGSSKAAQNTTELGNALKVGQLRVLGMKEELKSLGEEYNNLDSANQMQSKIFNLTQGQVDITDNTSPTKIKEYYDILQDIATVYQSLGQSNQKQLLETLFSEQYSSQGSAIIQSFQNGQVQKAYTSVSGSDGSAMQEQMQWMDSMEAKLQKMQAAFQTLSQTTLDSGFLKGLIDAGTSLINVLDTIMNRFGMFPTLMAGLGAGLGVKNLGICA